jgi:hypothetical protein
MSRKKNSFTSFLHRPVNLIGVILVLFLVVLAVQYLVINPSLSRYIGAYGGGDGREKKIYGPDECSGQNLPTGKDVCGGGDPYARDACNIDLCEEKTISLDDGDIVGPHVRRPQKKADGTLDGPENPDGQAYWMDYGVHCGEGTTVECDDRDGCEVHTACKGTCKETCQPNPAVECKVNTKKHLSTKEHDDNICTCKEFDKDGNRNTFDAEGRRATYRHTVFTFKQECEEYIKGKNASCIYISDSRKTGPFAEHRRCYAAQERVSGG